MTPVLAMQGLRMLYVSKAADLQVCVSGETSSKPAANCWTQTGQCTMNSGQRAVNSGIIDSILKDHGDPDAAASAHWRTSQTVLILEQKNAV